MQVQILFALVDGRKQRQLPLRDAAEARGEDQSMQATMQLGRLRPVPVRQQRRGMDAQSAARPLSSHRRHRSAARIQIMRRCRRARERVRCDYMT